METYDQNVLAIDIDQHITSINDAEAVHKRMIQLRTNQFLGTGRQFMPHYRGEQVHGWDINPGIFRTAAVKQDFTQASNLEKQAMDEFEKQVHAQFGRDALRTLFHNEKHGRDWDLLLQAQHAGVKTRLLDWTPEVISALFFCTEESNEPTVENADGQLWAYMVPHESLRAHMDYPVKDTFYEQDPSTLHEGCLINSSIYLDDLKNRVFESRMYKQKGRFFIGGAMDCHIPMNKQKAVTQNLFRFKVLAADKPLIRKELTERGITRDYFYVQESQALNDLVDAVNTKIYS